LKVVY